MYFSHATTGLLQSVLACGESPLEMRFSYLPSHLTRYQVQGQYDVLFPSSRPACIWRCAPLFPFHWLTKLYFAACTWRCVSLILPATRYQMYFSHAAGLRRQQQQLLARGDAFLLPYQKILRRRNWFSYLCLLELHTGISWAGNSVLFGSCQIQSLRWTTVPLRRQCKI